MLYRENRPSRKRFLAIVLVVTLGLLAVLFILEKVGVTDLYSTSTPVAISETARPVNDIDYSPATPTDNEDINQKKESGQLGAEASPPQPKGEPIDISLAAAGQDTAKGPVVVRTLITNATSGSCELRLTKDSVVRTYTSTVKSAGTYYTCDGFNIATSELSAGQWKIAITVTSGDRTGSAEQITDVSL